MEERSSVTLLVQALRDLSHRLPAGARLPSVRSLMSQHRVSPVTVRQAMGRLAAEGLIDPRPGQGTFVAAPRRPRPAVGDYGWQALALGSPRVSSAPLAALLAAAAPRMINLAGGYPAEELQATQLVARALRRGAKHRGVWARMPPEGLGDLRAWFAGQADSAVAPHEVVITPGSQSAITAAFTALTVPGTPVLIESPTYVGAIVAAEQAAVRLIPVPTDRDGIIPDLLEQVLANSGARLLYLQPTYSNPAGTSLARDRRRQVLEIVAHAKAVLIEDDWARDLSFERAPPRPLIADDVHGHVVHLRSLTKSAAPGLRIGAMVARGAVLDRLAAHRVTTDFFVPGPMQHTALELVESSAWQLHLRRTRGLLLNRRDALAAAVARRLGPNAVASLPLGGLHLWVRLADRTDDTVVARRAAEAGVLVSSGRQWFPAEPTGSFLRLGFATAAAESFERGVEILNRVLESPERKRR